MPNASMRYVGHSGLRAHWPRRGPRLSKSGKPLLLDKLAPLSACNGNMTNACEYLRARIFLGASDVSGTVIFGQVAARRHLARQKGRAHRILPDGRPVALVRAGGAAPQ